jgi:hypothetical protein
MGRVSHSWTASDMTATASNSWILAATTSSQSSRPEFQHSSPTFRPGTLTATTVGTSSSSASPAVDYTDATAAAIFFFATYGKSFVPTFNCSIHNTSKCRTSHLVVHLCLQVSFFVGRTRLCRRGPKYGRIWRGRWHRLRRGTVIELYVLYSSLCEDYADFCVNNMYYCAKITDFH